MLSFITGSGFGSQLIRARQFDPRGRESVEVYRLEGTMVPVLISSGAALLAMPDQLVLTLGDFRGDVWTMDLPGKR